MERNTLFAVVLSALVLFAYQAFFVPPKQVQISKTTQTTVNNSVTDNAVATTPSPASIYSQTTSVSEKTDDYTIENPQEHISYTNMGGSLHKIDFIGNNPFPLTDILSVTGFDNVKYKGEKLDSGAVVLTYNGKWRITKEYQAQDNNVIKVRLEIKNLSGISSLEDFKFTAFEIDHSTADASQNSRENSLFEYSVSTNKIFRKGNATKFNEKNNKSAIAKVNWVGFRDHYHALVVKPDFETKGYEIKADSDKRLNVSIIPQDKNFAPGESEVYNFDIYLGPQNPWNMKKYGQGFEKIVAFSSFAIIEWVGEAIYYTIPFFHSIFKSWGVGIILISILIYGITYPLTMQSMMSMRKMQEVQPKIKALQERFKSDPQKLNMEMMEIYRREKINPFGGCLPFLIQMPFFMALYQILWRAQYFQGQGFLWIKDLSQPDRLIIFPFNLPLLGNELNILPILTGGVMFLQQKISSKNMVVTDEQQLMQQKMMMYILPVMMTFMFYKFASSWAIYFFIFYILSTATQWKIAKMSGKK